jgi:lipoate-protein ligase A
MTNQLWWFLNSGAGEPAFNMALDEALLKSAARLGAPVLRFYGWTAPAATFGYFQKIADVERVTSLRPLIRRPTGGGIVPHDADWTYALAFPPTHAWYEFSAVESYRHVHEWLHMSFSRLGVETQVAPDCHKTLPGQCFQGHERFDLLWHAKKIAGAAQRRTRDGLLIQGSVQPPSRGLDRHDWQLAMLAVGTERYDGRWEEYRPDAQLLKHAQTLADEKYSRDAYNRKR